MSWLDISTYIEMNGGAFILWFIMTAFALIVSASVYFENARERTSEGVEPSKLYVRVPFFISLSLFVVAVVWLMPTHEKILEVKIAKIKNEAVNKENIDKGIDTLERIGKKLECKYLGGCKK